MPTLLTMNADVSIFDSAGFKASTGMELRFDLNIAEGDLIKITGSEPRGLFVEYRRVTGYIRSDGRMYNKKAVSAAPYDISDPGELGVRLIANDPALNLTNGVSYKVSLFQLKDGKPVRLKSWYTTVVPSTDVSVDLTAFSPGPGQPILSVPDLVSVDAIDGAGEAGKAILGSDTTDEALSAAGGGAVGKAVFTASDAATARAALGIDLTDLDEVEWAATFSGFPGSGVAEIIYGARDTGFLYRWSGSQYDKISNTVTTSEITNSGSVGRAVVESSTKSAARSAIDAQDVAWRPASTDITDATSIGKSLVTTPSKPAARSAIDAVSNSWVVDEGCGVAYVVSE